MTEANGSWTNAMKPRTVKSGTKSVTVSSSHAYLIQPMGRTQLHNHSLRGNKHIVFCRCTVCQWPPVTLFMSSVHSESGS